MRKNSLANKNEITELNDNLVQIVNNHRLEVSELQASIEKLNSESNQAKLDFQSKIELIEQEKKAEIEQEIRNSEQKISESLEKEKETQNELKEQIRHLQEESNIRTGIWIYYNNDFLICLNFDYRWVPKTRSSYRPSKRRDNNS